MADEPAADLQLVKCLLTKRLETANDDEEEENDNQYTPETPPFMGMQRVFGSTDYKHMVAA